MNILPAVKKCFLDASRVSLDLFKIMIPIIILVKILKEFDLIRYLAVPLAPLMELVGLPAQTGLVWATAMASSLYGALIVLSQLASDMPPLTAAQATVLGTMLLIAHNLLVEGRIAQKCGLSFLGQTVIRLSAALVCGSLLRLFFAASGLGAEPAVLLWKSSPENAGLGLWALGELKTLGLVFCVIFALMGLMRILAAVRITELFNWMLGPPLRLMGIGKSAATITVIGLTLGIAYGGGLIIHETRSGKVEPGDVFPSLTLMGLSHALIEDTLLMKFMGALMLGTFWGRLLFSLLAMLLLSRLPALRRSKRAAAWLLVLGLSLAAFPARAPAADNATAEEGATVYAGGFTGARLKDLQERITKTGLERDVIPPIEKPRFMSKEDASLVMEGEDIVFVLEAASGPRVYPRRILVWHEIVNDVVDDEKVSVTYSPLTGAVAAYKGAIEKFSVTFGNAGGLLNCNTILYDRSTDSRFPQIMGLAMSGPLRGKELKALPLLWTTWDRAKAAFPDAKVLSRTTGHRRNYERDPYGAYSKSESYYNNARLLYPLTNFDERLPPKTRIIGVRQDTSTAGVVISAAGGLTVGNFEVGSASLAAFYDKDLDAVRLFDRKASGRTLDFMAEAGVVYDVQTRSEWRSAGVAVSGPLAGLRLARVAGMDCMWFAWAAFFPDTGLVNWVESKKKDME